MEGRNLKVYIALLIVVFIPELAFGVSIPDCAGCNYQSTNVGYLPHSDCTKFIRCERDGVSGSFTYRYFEQTCAQGTMWSQPDLTCITKTNTCQSNHTDNDCYGTLSADPANCAGYRVCLEGIGYQEQCCPEGDVWDDSTSTCVPRDSVDTCTDTCDPCDGCCGAVITTCQYTVSSTCARQYIVITNGSPVTMSCPYGQMFSESECTCVPTSRSVCPCCFFGSPPSDCDLDCPFMSSLTCRNYIWVDNQDVALSTSIRAAYYNGVSSKQEIPYFANFFNNKNVQQLTVSLAVRPVSTSAQRVGLINNGNCYNYPSFHISYENGVVYAGFDTDHALINGADLFSTPVSLGVWTFIKITYDGTYARLYKGGIITATVPLQGAIRNSHAPVFIGFEAPFNANNICGSGFFHGYICEVKVCLDV